MDKEKTFVLYHKPTFEELFESTVKAIRKEDENWNVPLEKDYSSSYELMWIELGRMEEAAERYKFIQRFWVMQAAYEGLVFSCTLAVIATLSARFNGHLETLHVCLGIGLSIIGAICCLYEAKLCAETQIKEVILSYYTHTKKMIS